MFYSQISFRDVLPVVLEVICDVNHDPVSPIDLEKWTGKGTVEYHHLSRNSIRREGNIVNRQPVLLIRAIESDVTSTVRPVSGVTS